MTFEKEMEAILHSRADSLIELLKDSRDLVSFCAKTGLAADAPVRMLQISVQRLLDIYQEGEESVPEADIVPDIPNPPEGTPMQ